MFLVILKILHFSYQGGKWDTPGLPDPKWLQMLQILNIPCNSYMPLTLHSHCPVLTEDHDFPFRVLTVCPGVSSLSYPPV